jgi:hypothetical protein
MIYVYGARPLGISFANTCFSFTQKKNLLMERNVRLVLLMGIFFKPCLQHTFLLVQNFAKMRNIKVNKGNILSQYSLF